MASGVKQPFGAESGQREIKTDLDLVIVGGCGHVGLPLALSLIHI